MNHPMQPIIQHLFQVSSLEDISRQRLEAFVAEYPAFGIGHYLLSHKLQTEGADSYMEETQKTNLYFTNPLWLQWLLENSPEARARKAAEIAHPAEAEVAVEAEAGSDSEELSIEPAVVASAVGPVTETSVEPVKDTMEVVVEEALFAGAEAAAEEVTAAAEPTAAESLLQRIEEAKGLRESLQKVNDNFNTGESPAAEGHTEEPIKDEEPPFVLDEEIDPAAEAGKAIEAPQPVKEEKPATEQTFVFEPYHTIDYFASQGIKLTLEENPSDQLGKQLKSFTDWLKVMRRLPQKEREIIPDRASEQTVQTIAAHSVIGREVVTETMAEVLAKQGMPERARAVYEKLSLLNPDKRAYFATKIEQLNSL
jgi:hypothetical protein